MVRDAVRQRGGDLGIAQIGGIAFGIEVALRDRVEAPQLGRAVARHRKRAARGEGVDAAIDGPRLGYAAPQIKSGRSGGLDLDRDGAARHQRLDLRSEAEGAAVIGIVKRLDPQRIARDEQFLPPRIPDREGIHAAHALQHVRAAPLIELEQHFAVALAGEHRALGDQLGADRLVIVDLAIEGQHQAAVMVRHWLCAGGRQVDD